EVYRLVPGCPTGEFRRRHIPHNWDELLLHSDRRSQFLLNPRRRAACATREKYYPVGASKRIQDLVGPRLPWKYRRRRENHGDATRGQVVTDKSRQSFVS